jgi:thioredoxin
MLLALYCRGIGWIPLDHVSWRVRRQVAKLHMLYRGLTRRWRRWIRSKSFDYAGPQVKCDDIIRVCHASSANEPRRDFAMLSRRSVLLAAIAGSAAFAAPASATGPQPFDDAAFAAAQKAGKPIFVAIHATWCPTCKAQKPILSELMADPKFKNLVYFTIDFDSQKDLVRRFGARMQSTLISFIGSKEQGRSVGDSNRASISDLLNMVL